MQHKNGRMIYGITFDALRSGDRNRCRVMARRKDCITGVVDLIGSGPDLGSPITPDDLSGESRREYDEWLKRKQAESPAP